MERKERKEESEDGGEGKYEDKQYERKVRKVMWKKT